MAIYNGHLIMKRNYVLISLRFTWLFSKKKKQMAKNIASRGRYEKGQVIIYKDIPVQYLWCYYDSWHIFPKKSIWKLILVLCKWKQELSNKPNLFCTSDMRFVYKILIRNARIKKGKYDIKSEVEKQDTGAKSLNRWGCFSYLNMN